MYEEQAWEEKLSLDKEAEEGQTSYKSYRSPQRWWDKWAAWEGDDENRGRGEDDRRFNPQIPTQTRPSMCTRNADCAPA